MRDLGKWVVVDDGACVGVAGVYNPRSRYAEAWPDFAVLCTYACCFEGVAEVNSICVSSEGGDEQGLDVARCRCGGRELCEESEDMCSSAAACGVDGLCAVDGARVWVGMEEEGMGEEYGASREYAEERRRDGAERKSVSSETSHGRTKLNSAVHTSSLSTTSSPTLTTPTYPHSINPHNIHSTLEMNAFTHSYTVRSRFRFRDAPCHICTLHTTNVRNSSRGPHYSSLSSCATTILHCHIIACRSGPLPYIANRSLIRAHL